MKTDDGWGAYVNGDGTLTLPSGTMIGGELQAGYLQHGDDSQTTFGIGGSITEPGVGTLGGSVGYERTEHDGIVITQEHGEAHASGFGMSASAERELHRARHARRAACRSGRATSTSRDSTRAPLPSSGNRCSVPTTRTWRARSAPSPPTARSPISSAISTPAPPPRWSHGLPTSVRPAVGKPPRPRRVHRRCHSTTTCSVGPLPRPRPVRRRVTSGRRVTPGAYPGFETGDAGR